MTSSDNLPGLTRRRGLALAAAVLPTVVAGCSEQTTDSEEPRSLESFLSDNADLDSGAGETFSSAYDTVMNTPVDQLAVGDFEQAHSQFSQAQDDYERLQTRAEDERDTHEQNNTDRVSIFETLATFYDLMVEASAFGFQGLDSLLNDEDIIQAFSRSNAAFKQMEDSYDDATDRRKEITLYRDTLDTDIESIVGSWVSDNEDRIVAAHDLFETATEEYASRAYPSAQQNYATAGERYGTLLDDINSQFATKYPRESDLYQLYGDVSYFISRMRDVADALARSARLRNEADYESAGESETTAREAHPEAVDTWEEAQEQLSALSAQTEPPALPAFGDEQESLESREEAKAAVSEWLEDHEDTINSASNARRVADEQYDEERYDDAGDWYRNAAEGWKELQQAASTAADSYEQPYAVETFGLLRDYYQALGQRSEAMEQAAAAREAGVDREASEWETEADEYDQTATELGEQLTERLPDN